MKKKNKSKKILKIFLIIFILGIGIVSFLFYKRYKEVIPFYFKWKTYHSELGFSVSYPPNWYVNSDNPLTITELKDGQKWVKKQFGYGYDKEAKVLIWFDVQNWNYVETIKTIRSGYQLNKQTGAINTQIITEKPIVLNDNKAIIIRGYPSSNNITNIIAHLTVIIKDENDVIILGHFQILYNKIPNYQVEHYEKTIYKIINSIKIDEN